MRFQPAHLERKFFGAQRIVIVEELNVLAARFHESAIPRSRGAKPQLDHRFEPEMPVLLVAHLPLPEHFGGGVGAPVLHHNYFNGPVGLNKH